MCLKCIILVPNFQKLPRAGSLCPQRPLIFNFGELKLRNFVQIVILQADYDKIEFQKSIMTSF